ncbi:MAG: outer membrane beta-barrel protein [Rhodobacteraceae bacterium]|nr:outer membrane beta-barrel protein [Paracoccaceae bacterium]
MKPFRLAAPLCLIAAPALAGSLSQPATDPVAVTPLFVPAPVGEWTGFYLGGQVGYGDGGVPGTDYDGGLAGVHAGYLHDLGDWVVGGELDYDFANMSGGPGKIDAIGRAKLIGGYDLGRTLVYATAGAFHANLALPGGDRDDNGAFIGAGMKYKFTDTLIGGVEALYHEADDFGGVAGNDLDAATITARISYQF